MEMTVKGFDFGIDNMDKDLLFSACFLQAWQQAGQRVLYDVYFAGERFTDCGSRQITVDRTEAAALMYTVRACAEAAEQRAGTGLNYVEFVLAD